MNISTKIFRVTIIGLSGALTLLDAAAQTPSPPALISPANGHALYGVARGTVPPPVFSWAAPPLFNGRAPQSYRLCIVEQGGTCDAPSALVFDVGLATSRQVQLPQSFLEKILRWTAAACGPGYGAGGRATQSSAAGTDCSWASFYTLDTRSTVTGSSTLTSNGQPLPTGPRASLTSRMAGSATPAGNHAPRLGNPGPNDPIRMQQNAPTPVTFMWSAPVSTFESAAGAPPPQSYVFCVREENVSCNAPNALVLDVGRVTHYNAQLPPHFYGKRLAWTVAACGPGFGSTSAPPGTPEAKCTWAPSVVFSTVSASGAAFN
jgi:hypothetical protein